MGNPPYKVKSIYAGFITNWFLIVRLVKFISLMMADRLLHSSFTLV